MRRRWNFFEWFISKKKKNKKKDKKVIIKYNPPTLKEGKTIKPVVYKPRKVGIANDNTLKNKEVLRDNKTDINEIKDENITKTKEAIERPTIVKPSRGVSFDDKLVTNKKDKPPISIVDKKVEYHKKRNKASDKKDENSYNDISLPEIPEIDNIEQNISLVPAVNIKKDLLDELEETLRKNYTEIQNIKFELNLLDKKELNAVDKKEINSLLEELDYLIKKLETIKKQLYQDNYKQIYAHETDSTYVKHLINEYKESFLENNSSKSSISKIEQVKDYINLINDIIDIEKRKDVLNNRLETKKEQLEIKDNEFEQYKDACYDVEKTNNYINTFIVEQNSIINDISKKVSESTNITKTVEYKSKLAIDYTKLLTSTLLMATTGIIPTTKNGNLLKVGLMCFGIANFASAIKVKTRERKTTTIVSFVDYENEIKNNISSVSDMSLLIDKAMLDIRNLKKDFEKEFGEYKHLIPDYINMLIKLDSIEKELFAKYQLANSYEQKLEKILEKNNVKVKRLDEEYHD